MTLPALPREVEADVAHDAIRARLASRDRLLWSAGQVMVPLLPLAPALASSLARAYGAGQLVLGLEGATKALATETRGLALRDRGREGPTPRARVSRLLLLSDDGAERLYRHAEGLVVAHGDRVLACVLAADARTLGRATTGRDVSVKVVLVAHKHAVAPVMRALAG